MIGMASEAETAAVVAERRFTVTELSDVDDELDLQNGIGDQTVDDSPSTEHTAVLSEKVNHLDNRVTRVEQDLKHSGTKPVVTDQKGEQSDAPLDLLEFM